MKNFVIGIVIIVLLILGFALYQNRNTEMIEGPSPSPSPVSAQSETMDNGEAEEIKEFVINGNNFSFSPNTITVQRGDRVRITFVNTGGFHDLKIDEFNVATAQIQGNNRDAVEFTADRSGSFEFYCSIGNHRAMGMKGTLFVTE